MNPATSHPASLKPACFSARPNRSLHLTIMREFVSTTARSATFWILSAATTRRCNPYNNCAAIRMSWHGSKAICAPASLLWPPSLITFASTTCVACWKNWPWTERPPSSSPACVLRQDSPAAEQYLPRPLTTDQDQSTQQELLRRNDRDSNALLLLPTHWHAHRRVRRLIL